MARKAASKPTGKLAITNYGIIKQVDLALTKNLIVIGGGNGQGKTSVLRAIHTCIVGKRAVEGKTSPVRDGEQEGSVFLDLGDLEIMRRFNAKDQYEVVLKRNGRVETSKVQDRLDALCSKMTFDPSFLWDSKVDEKQRARMFLEAAGVDFSDLESKRAELYAQRTEIGRERDRLKGALDKYPLDFDAPDAPVDVMALGDTLREQMESNAGRSKAQDAILMRQERYERYKIELAEVRREIKILQDREKHILEEGKAFGAKTAELTTLLEAMPEYDTAALRAQYGAAGIHNEAYRAGLQRAEFGKALSDAEASRENLTIAIEHIDAEKQARLHAAKLPLEGLSATEEGIWLDGHPISRASGRDRLTVALSIAFANCDPDFPLVCCDGGEQFDPEWLPHIEAMAEEAGVVVILTRVAKDAQCTVIMQDGQIYTDDIFVGVGVNLDRVPEPPVSRTDEEKSLIEEAFAGVSLFDQKVAFPEIEVPVSATDETDSTEEEWRAETVEPASEEDL